MKLIQAKKKFKKSVLRNMNKAERTPEKVNTEFSKFVAELHEKNQITNRDFEQWMF
jgi:hypothetical protein